MDEQTRRRQLYIAIRRALLNLISAFDEYFGVKERR